MAVSIETEPELRVGEPAMLLEDAISSSGFFRRYDVGPDGRFVTMSSAEQFTSEPRELMVVEGWFEDLKRLAPIEN